MQPISIAQMIEVDHLMVDEYGITLPQMMENAGRSLADLARRILGGNAAGRKVAVMVGKGNNGGGGLVAARHLANAGADIHVLLAAAPGELGTVPEMQRRVLARMGVIGSDHTTAATALPALLEETELVLDALVGYSLRGDPREPVASFIRAANAAAAQRLALDIPSGLEGDSGQPLAPCLEADVTLTLAWPKAGLLAETARPYVGQLYLTDIGVPAAAYRAIRVDPGQIFASGPIVRVNEQNMAWKTAAEPGPALR